MSLKVLLADDSMTAQNMGKKILVESGYDVTTVSNGAAAVKKIAEVKPDLVILDIYMPGYTGLEVCERVRSNFDTANLPVLLTVGKMEPYRAEDGAKVRADGVIVKPFEATDLLAVVKKMTERSAAASARRPAPEPEPEESYQDATPEPAAAAHVDVPSELAVAPALGIEEFEAPAPEPNAFAAAASWSASVEQASVTPEIASPQLAEIPWAFDSTPVPDEPAHESSSFDSAPSFTPDPSVEFNSAPQATDIEVTPAENLEPEAEQTASMVETTEPELAKGPEITDFATSFSAHVEPEPELNVFATPAEPASETSWNGWAEPNTEEAELEAPKTSGVIDDFEAKVAAAMAGFGTEPVEAAPETATQETAAEPVDDFEAKVAAAMSGFSTEPVAEQANVEVVEPASQTSREAQEKETAPTISDDFEAKVAAAMSGFEAKTPDSHGAAPEETQEIAKVVAAPAKAADDFDARLAAAMASFEPARDAEATPAFEEAAKPTVNLNETMVLPQEAVLSLEEEMRQAMAQPESHSAPAELTPETLAEIAPSEEPAAAPEAPLAAPPQVAWEPSASITEPELETHVMPEPELMGEFDPLHVAHEAESRNDHHPDLHQMVENALPVTPQPTSTNGDKFADAVHRAIERLKPQLIAEIVKELKGE